MSAVRVRSRRAAVASAAVSAAAVVALVVGPGGAQTSTAADFSTVAALMAAGSAPEAPGAPEGPEAPGATASHSRASSDYFLKLDGIDGESSDEKHKGEILIESFSWGLSNPTTIGSAGGGAGAGKVVFQDLHFVASYSKASPKLMLACATGEHIKTAVLTARKAGKGQQEYLRYELSDLLVSSFQTGGSGHVPRDQVSLNFSKIVMEHTTQSADGSVKTVRAGYDIKANTKV